MHLHIPSQIKGVNSAKRRPLTSDPVGGKRIRRPQCGRSEDANLDSTPGDASVVRGDADANAARRMDHSDRARGDDVPSLNIPIDNTAAT